MILENEILSLEYLNKTEFTGSHQGMRYRLEKKEELSGEEKKKSLKVTIWPEPFNFFTTPDDQKTTAEFGFSPDGVKDAVAWMNDRLLAEEEKWNRANEKWDSYSFD